MPKFNNIYCTLCAIIYVQLLGYCHGKVMRNITGLNAAVDHLEETLKILTEKVNAVPKILEDWENEGPCRRFGNFASCSDAIQVQTRTCIDGTLDKCTDEERHRITTCKNAGTCVDCVWSDWTVWDGPCVICSQNQNRTRTIATQSSNGGSQCVGNDRETRLCWINHPNCPELLSQDEDGFTKLHGAAWNNRIEEAEKMMKEANNLNIVSELVNKGSNSGYTPLFVTSFKGHLQMAQLLLNNGAEIDKASNDGWTPLMRASYFGHLEIVKLLIKNGADIDKASNGGSTPLMLASYRGHLEIVKLLMEHQADVHLKNDDGETALDYARRGGHPAIEKALEEAGAK